jgi:hypothetical protein
MIGEQRDGPCRSGDNGAREEHHERALGARPRPGSRAVGFGVALAHANSLLLLVGQRAFVSANLG